VGKGVMNITDWFKSILQIGSNQYYGMVQINIPSLSKLTTSKNFLISMTHLASVPKSLVSSGLCSEETKSNEQTYENS
jgi:sorbitol-specific phosphotransferase system component IIC